MLFLVDSIMQEVLFRPDNKIQRLNTTVAWYFDCQVERNDEGVLQMAKVTSKHLSHKRWSRKYNTKISKFLYFVKFTNHQQSINRAERFVKHMQVDAYSLQIFAPHLWHLSLLPAKLKNLSYALSHTQQLCAMELFWAAKDMRQKCDCNLCKVY